jgi:hypothetical protein
MHEVLFWAGRSKPALRLSFVNFLLSLMRMGHTIMGITPPPPEKERAFLLGWIVALILVFLLSIATVLFLIPHVMR